MIISHVIKSKQIIWYKLSQHPTNCKAENIDFNWNIKVWIKIMKIEFLVNLVYGQIKTAYVLNLKQFIKF